MAISLSFFGRENDYVIDPECAAEPARLAYQDNLFSHSLGGAFPERPDLKSVHDILDLACGSGGWTLETAEAYPDKQVIGVDLSPSMIAYANARTQAHNLCNLTFQIQDILEPLIFPDASFDLINARLICSLVPRESWHSLLTECYRLLRPGGILRLTEAEWPLTTSGSFDRYGELFSRALFLQGKSFSPRAHRIGIIPMLPHFLHAGGYRNVQSKAFAVDFSNGMPDYNGYKQNFIALFQLLAPFLMRTGVLLLKDHDPLFQQTLREIMEDDFCAVMFLMTAWGEKPR